MMKRFRRLDKNRKWLLFSAVLLSGSHLSSCGKSDKDDVIVLGAMPTPIGGQNSSPEAICRERPLSPGEVEVRYDEKNVERVPGASAGPVNWKGDAYLCGHSANESAAGKPVLALLVGYLGEVEQKDARISELASAWIKAASASHRRGCVFMLSKINLERLASRMDLNHLSVLGQGQDGKLVSIMGRGLIGPDRISEFRASRIRGVSFHGSQVARRQQEWLRLFRRSRLAALNLSADELAVATDMGSIRDEIQNIASCRQ